MKLLRKGKVKEVYDQGENLLFIFTDQISVFDKIIPSMIPDKGASLARTSSFWFNIAQKMGLKNHFLSLESGNRMVVRKFNVIEGNVPGAEKNYLIPLEFVMRYYVAGSLNDRIERGKLDYRDIGFRNRPKYGEKLPEPVFEMTTKFEKTDRLLDEREAMQIGGLSREDIQDIREIILKMDERINSEVLKRGLIHADGKKEFAMDSDRNPVIVDTFGTADEDRFWEKSEYENGNIIEKSKEFVRQYYRSIGYYDELMKARSSGANEPPIPALPEDMIVKTSSLYRSLYERITGMKW